MENKRYKDIFMAIYADDIEAVKSFLPKHANDVDSHGVTALLKTIFANNKQMFDLLLANGAAPYAGTTIHSVLYYLWANNWSDRIQTVVDHGLDLNSDKSLEITDICRSLGRSNVNSIHFDRDLFNRDLAFLKEFIRYGARTDIPDEKGKLPLDYLPEGVRTEIDTYIANLEAERMGNTAHKTEFAYGV